MADFWSGRLVSLDAPEAFRPAASIFVGSAPAWAVPIAEDITALFPDPEQTG
jgi:hypothetical protein